MAEKLDNEEFKIVRVSGDVIGKNSNKLKLQLASRVAFLDIMKVFMEEELDRKEDEVVDTKASIASGELSKKEKARLIDKLKKYNNDFDVLSNNYDEFVNKYSRMYDVAKKLLALPQANLDELMSVGTLDLSGDNISYSEINNTFAEATDKASVFSNVDKDAIKKEVEKVLNVPVTDDKNKEKVSFAEYAESNLNPSNFDSFNKTITSTAKKNLDNLKNSEVTATDVKDAFPDFDNSEVILDSPSSSETNSKNENTEVKETSNDPIFTNNDTNVGVTTEQEVEKTGENRELNPFPGIDFSSSSINFDASLREDTSGKDTSIKTETDNADDFGIDDDPEVIRLKEEMKKAQDELAGKKAKASEVDAERQKTEEEKKEAKEEADKKKAEAELAKIEYRNNYIAKQKQALAELMAEINSVDTKIKSGEEEIRTNREAISDYKESITASEQMINEFKGRSK